MKLIIITASLLASAYCTPVGIPSGGTAPELGPGAEGPKPVRRCVPAADIARIGQVKPGSQYKPQGQYKPEGQYKPASFGWDIPGLSHYGTTWYGGKPIVGDVSDKWNHLVHYFSSFPFGKYDRKARSVKEDTPENQNYICDN